MHLNQKRAVALLEPIFRDQPDHPGAAHYLIHAYHSAELAPSGLAAARAYSKIAPSAPHALHMPSHIFTRLGLWEDSIASNELARAAAHDQGDPGEELHAMDYLTYAYLQQGRDADAVQVVAALPAMVGLLGREFKIDYAATAMPVRLAIERHKWSDAARLQPLPKSAPTWPPSSIGRARGNWRRLYTQRTHFWSFGRRRMRKTRSRNYRLLRDRSFRPASNSERCSWRSIGQKKPYRNFALRWRWLRAGVGR